MTRRPAGTVYLVGAGPGDPGLLTLKGAECLGRADVVVYDRLVNPLLLELAAPSAQRVCVGKTPGEPAIGQDAINDLLVRKARSGKTVCRLKGGDPFVFGRGGEEALRLAREGIPFEVVPGVTSAIAAPAYAGIPVTHRGLASSVVFVTGSEDPAKPKSSVDWAALAKGAETLVILMGAANLAPIADALISGGRDPQTPLAVVNWGTYPRQTVVEATLDEARRPDLAERVQPPVVVVVGKVAALRAQLRWFERRPLFGKRIVVTRPRAQAPALARRLEELGAETLELPAIRVEPLSDFRRLDAALRRLGSYDWAVFTSANGVRACFERLAALGKDARAFGGAKVAAIGEATARELQSRGIVSDFMPVRYTSKTLAEAFHRRRSKGLRFLLPRADIAPDDLPAALRARGARVTAVAAYRTVQAKPEKKVVDALAALGADLVTFTSASTVRGFVELATRISRRGLPSKSAYASIGPETTKAAAAHGLEVAVEADPHTVAGLVEAIVSYFQRAEQSRRRG
jgi:uroporphyrinogen III methyltransferase/synthase